jgi:hypothetical protein
VVGQPRSLRIGSRSAPAVYRWDSRLLPVLASGRDLGCGAVQGLDVDRDETARDGGTRVRRLGRQDERSGQPFLDCGPQAGTQFGGVHDPRFPTACG